MIHADSNSSEGDVTVAAFAVYSQPVNCSFMSRLPTSIRAAWSEKMKALVRSGEMQAAEMAAGTEFGMDY